MAGSFETTVPDVPWAKAPRSPKRPLVMAEFSEVCWSEAGLSVGEDTNKLINAVQGRRQSWCHSTERKPDHCRRKDCMNLVQRHAKEAAKDVSQPPPESALVGAEVIALIPFARSAASTKLLDDYTKNQWGLAALHATLG